MSLEELQKRVDLLKSEHHKAVSQISTSHEQLENAKKNASVIFGHLSEATYQLQQASQSQEVNNG